MLQVLSNTDIEIAVDLGLLKLAIAERLVVQCLAVAKGMVLQWLVIATVWYCLVLLRLAIITSLAHFHNS